MNLHTFEHFGYVDRISRFRFLERLARHCDARNDGHHHEKIIVVFLVEAVEFLLGLRERLPVEQHIMVWPENCSLWQRWMNAFDIKSTTPPIAQRFPNLVRRGARVAAPGYGTRNQYGTAVQASAFGSPANMAQLYDRVPPGP